MWLDAEMSMGPQNTNTNPRPLGFSAERAPLGGGAYSAPPPHLPNSRTNRRSEAGEAAIESPEREDSNAH